jgi:hypothetical protein
MIGRRVWYEPWVGEVGAPESDPSYNQREKLVTTAKEEILGFARKKK